MKQQKPLFLSTTAKKRSKRVDFLGFLPYLCTRKIKAIARVAKLVDAPDLGSGVLRRVGSSPITRTIGQKRIIRENFPLFLCKIGNDGSSWSQVAWQSHALRDAIRRRCKFKRYNRQREQQKVTRSAAPVVPRGLRKASVVNFTIRIDNADSGWSNEGRAKLVPFGPR